jgi:hypothetical protein
MRHLQDSVYYAMSSDMEDFKGWGGFDKLAFRLELLAKTDTATNEDMLAIFHSVAESIIPDDFRCSRIYLALCSKL